MPRRFQWVVGALVLPLAGVTLPVAAVAQSGGAALVAELGCVGCHSGLPEATPIGTRAPVLGPSGPPLEAAFVLSYLADPEPRQPDIGRSRMPDFGLDEGERLALALFLGTRPEDDVIREASARHPDVDAALGARIFDALGCVGCHTHAEVPGPIVGPDLSNEGARVREAWLRDFLREPRPIRSLAHPSAPGSRMPDFRLTSGELEQVAGFLMTLGAPTQSQPLALSDFTRATTTRLLEDRLSCLGCHRVGDEGGLLAPPLDGIGERLQESYVVAMILDPATAAPGAPMPRAEVTQREARRLARLLMDSEAEWEGPASQSLADREHPAWTALGEAVGAGTDGEGARLYARYCASCHGAEGRADGWNVVSLPLAPAVHADPEAMGRRPDDTLFDGIHAGGYVLDGSPRMPGFGGLLNNAQIRDLVAYIRVLCNCRQPAWAGGDT